MSRLRSVCCALAVAVACGGPQQLGGTGATCFRDDDCAAGMICVAPKPTDIHRVCSTDPTPLISTVEGPPAMTVAGMGGMGGMAGTAGMPTAGAPAAGSDVGGNASAGTAGAGGKAGSGGVAGSATGGSDSAGTSGTAGTAPDGGAPP